MSQRHTAAVRLFSMSTVRLWVQELQLLLVVPMWSVDQMIPVSHSLVLSRTLPCTALRWLLRLSVHTGLKRTIAWAQATLRPLALAIRSSLSSGPRQLLMAGLAFSDTTCKCARATHGKTRLSTRSRHQLLRLSPRWKTAHVCRTAQHMNSVFVQSRAWAQATRVILFLQCLVVWHQRQHRSMRLCHLWAESH